jgi:regulator of protease activity HflC (stomatin/prohibitin superfamily)
VAEYIETVLQERASRDGIEVLVNLRAVTFINQNFVDTLEEKATAAQQEEIKRREALAAEQEAIRVENVARGVRNAAVQVAEGEKQALILSGEGERDRQIALAEGQLAVATANAEGRRLLNDALSGPGGALIRDIEVLGGLGANVDFYGVPTGAEGTNTYIIDEALRGQFAVPTSN